VQAEEGRRRLVRVFYGVTASPLGQGDRHERAIKSIYKAAGWDLADERYLQIQGCSPRCRSPWLTGSAPTWSG
jgi:conjugal transfer ATP-binding protein TraC